MRTLFFRLWNSPTFTSWGSRASQSIRLLIILPLVINTFDEVQLSAWFLFSSIIFFSEMMSMQTSLVFSRMFALANGGASDLSPIRDGKVQESSGQPNWPLIGSLYGTTQSLNAILAVLGLLLVLVLGYFSLAPVVEGYADSQDIWLAFIVFALGTFIVEFFRKYQVALRGMNHVALTSRWDTLFNLISPIAGAAMLLSGGSIFELAVVMQAVLSLGILRQWALLHFVAEPQFRNFRLWGWDRQILIWVWEPLWRGIVQMLANRGSTRVSTIALARYTDPALLAPILLAVRLLDILESFSDTPITSHAPRFGRLLAAGQIDRFRQGMERAFRLSSWVQVGGVIAIGLFASAGLQVLGTDKSFIAMSAFFSLGIAHTLLSTVRKSLMITMVGNNVVAVERFILATAVTTVLAFTIIPASPFWGFLASAYLPVVLIANIKPLLIGCRSMNTCMSKFAAHTFIIPYTLLLAMAYAVIILPIEAVLQQAADTFINLTNTFIR